MNTKKTVIVNKDKSMCASQTLTAIYYNLRCICYSRQFCALILLLLVNIPLAEFSVALAADPPPPTNTTPTNPTPTVVDTAAIDEATCWLLHFQTGTFGGLLLAVSAVGAVTTAALGSYKSTINCLIVAISCYSIGPMATLMLGTNLPDCVTILGFDPPI